MSIKKYIATDKHPTLKEGTEMIVRGDGSVNINWMIARSDILALWIEKGWVRGVQGPKWNDSELKEMCIAYAKEADLHINSDHRAIETAFDLWYTNMTNPATDTREIRS